MRHGEADTALAHQQPVDHRDIAQGNAQGDKAGEPGDVHKAVGLAFPDAGEILLIGETIGTLGQSLWLKEILNREEGAPPAINFEAERRNGDFVRGLIQDELLTACHDVSDGGLLLAVAEMAMAGGIGCSLADAPADMPAHAYWFGEVRVSKELFKERQFLLLSFP
ncbi:hypothetical protein DTJ15_03430 [Parasaccharibacter sp. TMW 2.1891]|nr:hypothetical protein [Parasaccharibacter sp. TMW 2.1891]